MALKVRPVTATTLTLLLTVFNCLIPAHLLVESKPTNNVNVNSTQLKQEVSLVDLAGHTIGKDSIYTTFVEPEPEEKNLTTTTINGKILDNVTEKNIAADGKDKPSDEDGTDHPWFWPEWAQEAWVKVRDWFVFNKGKFLAAGVIAGAAFVFFCFFCYCSKCLCKCCCGSNGCAGRMFWRIRF